MRVGGCIGGCGRKIGILAKVGGQTEGTAGGLIEGASWRLARTQSREADRRRKSEVGAEAEPEDWSAAQVVDRLERQPEDATADESRRLGLRQSRKVDQETQVN